MDTRQQEQGQVPPPWYPSPPPPFPPPPTGGGGAPSGYQHPFPQYPHQQQPPPHHQSYHHQLPPHPQQHQPWPTQPDYPQYHTPPPPPAGFHHGQPTVPPYHTGLAPYPQNVPPPPPHLAAAPPHGYPPPPNQVWGNPSWRQYHSWEHPERSVSYNNEEDWAARARAWAEAKSATENHHTQAQFTPVEHNHVYHEPFQQAAVPPEIQQSSFSVSQQLPVPVIDPPRRANQSQDPSTSGLESSFCSVDGRPSYGTRSEGLTAEKGTTTSPHVNFGSSSSVLEQEVPSSYSSISGKEARDQHEKLHMPFPPHIPSTRDGLHNSQFMLPFQFTPELPHLGHRDQFAVSSTDASDQPLVFDQRYTFDHGQNQKKSYGDADTAGPLGGTDIESASSVHAWTPPVPFSQIPPVPSGQQFDSSFGSISSISGHSAPAFGRIPGPIFHPSIPPVRPPFALGAGASLHNGSTFTEDANGAFNPVDRPKKASVPNWLREELMKKKAAIASSAHKQPIGSSHSIGADDNDNSFGQSNQADNKSVDSTRSAEDDEDDEEDVVQEARSAAINQEIKRVLTDILLKVTDELFEEIATKVINEDGLEVEVGHSVNLANQKASLSPLASTTPKASARVIVPVLGNRTRVSQVENSNSSLPRGNILGLANYESDDEDEEIQSSGITSSLPIDGASLHWDTDSTSENATETVEKEISLDTIKDSSGDQRDVENGGKKDSVKADLHLSARNSTKSKSVSQNADTKHDNKDTSKAVSEYREGSASVPSEQVDRVLSEHSNDSETKATIGGKSSTDTEIAHGHAKNGQQISSDARDIRSKSGSNLDKRSYISNDKIKVAEARIAKMEYSDDNGHRRGETRERKEKMDKRDYLNKVSKDRDSRQEKTVEVSESRKRNTIDSDTGSRKESRKDKKVRTKDETDRRDQTKKVKEDRAGQGDRDSHRSKVINSKDDSFSSDGGASSGEVSGDSKTRKSRFSKGSLSRSPPSSRRRQVSRSPHAKHSQRRHSPNSYSEKRRRSRSRSPVRRRR